MMLRPFAWRRLLEEQGWTRRGLARMLKIPLERARQLAMGRVEAAEHEWESVERAIGRPVRGRRRP